MIGRYGDYFAFLGLPRRLNLDREALEQRFRTLSRQFHPDFFYNATPAERRGSLERSSYLNDAYRTLKHPIARIEYLLELEGTEPAAGQSPSNGTRRSTDVPASLLEEVFALNEQLEAVRDMRAAGAPVEEWRTGLELARKPIEARRVEHEQQLVALSEEWDALADQKADGRKRQAVLHALRERMLERNYINNLLAGIDRELEKLTASDRVT